MKTKLIEARDRLGGRMLFYPEKMIWDVGGVTPILCANLIKQLEEQARTFEPTIVFEQQIEGFERQPDGTIILTAATGEKHWTRTVIMAIGYGIYKMAKLELEGADRYEVTNLHYTVQELEPFRGKRVLISGEAILQSTGPMSLKLWQNKSRLYIDAITSADWSEMSFV